MVPLILGQIALNLSILTACVPSLKGVLEMYWTGASNFIVATHHTSSHNKSASHGIQSRLTDKFRQSESEARTQKGIHKRSGQRGKEPHTILERSESQTNLNTITKTIEWKVHDPAAETPSTKTGSDGASQHSTDIYGCV